MSEWAYVQAMVITSQPLFLLLADRFILLLILRSRDGPRWYPHSLWIKVKNAFRDTLLWALYWKHSAKGTDQPLSSFTDSYQMLRARHCLRCWRSEVSSNNGGSSSMCLYSAYNLQALLLRTYTWHRLRIRFNAPLPSLKMIEGHWLENSASFPLNATTLS